MPCTFFTAWCPEMILTPADKESFSGETTTGGVCLPRNPELQVSPSALQVGSVHDTACAFWTCLTFIVLHTHFNPIIRKSSKCLEPTGAHLESPRLVSVVSTYFTKSHPWALSRTKRQLQWGEDGMFKRSKLIHAPEPWKSSRIRGSPLPLKVQVEWLRVGTEEGSLPDPLASSSDPLKTEKLHQRSPVRRDTRSTEGGGKKSSWEQRYWMAGSILKKESDTLLPWLSFKHWQPGFPLWRTLQRKRKF